MQTIGMPLGAMAARTGQDVARAVSPSRRSPTSGRVVTQGPRQIGGAAKAVGGALDAARRRLAVARRRAHDDAADLQPRPRQRQLEDRLLRLAEADQDDADGVDPVTPNGGRHRSDAAPGA